METRYIPAYVVFSVVVAIIASYVALDLANSVTQAKGRARAVWLGFGALAMGIGIWSMHFVGMLAFEMPGMEMGYDIPLFFLSIVVAVAASALALYVVSRPTVNTTSFIAGGLAMAIAIAGMHYTGMFSMKMNARIEWNLWLVALSVVIAMIASYAALWIAIRYRDTSDHHRPRALASVLMGLAISGMHYTGMLAATFVHDESKSLSYADLLASDSLALFVSVSTLLILGLALAGGAIDRALTARTKRAEESEQLFCEANQAIVELQKERELRDRFVTALAHDLRTPLAAGKMSVQLGIRAATDSDAVVKFNSKAIDSINRIDQMIQDLLDAHRISAGQSLPLKIEKCDVEAFLKKIIEDLTTVYGARFALNVDGKLEGQWDINYMRRALENLCTNAIKYGKEGSLVRVSASPSGPSKDGISLAVHNQGEPLAKEDHQRLFDIFSRGRNAHVHGMHGWGIGLTIVKGIAEAHGGAVEVESGATGTVFSLKLPVRLG